MSAPTTTSPDVESGVLRSPSAVRISDRLIDRIQVREWGMPSICMPGKIWRSGLYGTISCMLPHATDATLVRIETLPLEVVKIGEKQFMPDAWRSALWEYVKAWPSSGCQYGPFLAITEEQRCDFIRNMAADLVISDNIGCRMIAHSIGMFAAFDYELPESPVKDEMRQTKGKKNL